MKIDFRRL